MIRELNATVGPTVVQSMAGTRDPSGPQSWEASDGPLPPPEVEARLRLGYRVWRALEDVEGRHTALAWLVGANPRLGDDMPVLYIQQLREREVMGAALAYIDDVP